MVEEKPVPPKPTPKPPEPPTPLPERKAPEREKPAEADPAWPGPPRIIRSPKLGHSLLHNDVTPESRSNILRWINRLKSENFLER